MTLTEHMQAAERDYVRAALINADWNISAAAKAAGVNRTHMYRLMARNSIFLPRFRRHVAATLEQIDRWREAF